MDITIENLNSAVSESIAVVYHKFGMYATENNKNKLFCFYEGKDAPYYSYRITQFFNDDYLNFCCKNKNNVLKIYDKIKNNKNHFKLAFFVDQDFDDKIENIDIYETPTYSIENFYAYECFLSKVLKNEFYLNEEDSEAKRIHELFNEELDKYCDIITTYNAWYHSLKCKKKRESLDSTNVSLDDKLPNAFLVLEILSLEKKYTIEDILSKYQSAILVTKEEVLISEGILRNEIRYKKLRGKYILTFVIKFLDFLILDSKSSKSYIPTTINFHTDKTIIISQLTQYAHTPECLSKYLEHFKSDLSVA